MRARALSTYLLAAAGLATVISGCATAPEDPEPKALDPETARIRFAAPGFDEAAAMRRIVLSGAAREEYAFYRAPNGARAEIVLVEAAPGDPVTLVRPSDKRGVAAHVDGWRYNAGAVSGMGRIGAVALGPARLRYRTFDHTLANRGCAVFTAAWGGPKGQGVGHWLLGYYCAPGGTAAAHDEAGRVLTRLRLRDVPSPWSGPVGHEPTRPLPEDAGHVAYPFGYARPVSALDGDAAGGSLGGVDLGL